MFSDQSGIKLEINKEKWINILKKLSRRKSLNGNHIPQNTHLQGYKWKERQYQVLTIMKSNRTSTQNITLHFSLSPPWRLFCFFLPQQNEYIFLCILTISYKAYSFTYMSPLIWASGRQISQIFSRAPNR